MCRSSEPKWCKSDVYMLCGSQDGAVLLIPSCKASCLVETYLVEDIQLYFEDHATYKGYVAEIIGMCRSSVPNGASPVFILLEVFKTRQNSVQL